jgi:type I restriction enzyme S subunit
MSEASRSLVRLDQVVEINPKESLAKGVLAPYIEMAALSVNDRRHNAPVMRAAASGSRFVDGDTLLARITPCLENGKTAQVQGLGEGVVGWGSTEFIVLRACSGITDPDFVYLLARDPLFRDYAIQQMTGTSGRQRVPFDSIASYEVEIPPLAEQKRIARVLGTIDAAIEGARSIVITLEKAIELEGTIALQEASASFMRLPELAEITNGYSYTSSELVDDSDDALVNLKNFGRHGGFRIDGLKPFAGSPKVHQVLTHGDLMVAKTDLTQDAEVIGRCLRMPTLPHFKRYAASLDIAIVRTKGLIPKSALHAMLAQPDFRDHCLGFTNGTTVLHMSKDALQTYEVPVLPKDALEELASRIEILTAQQDRTLVELYHLQAARDFLLPRLVSGELQVKETVGMLAEVL